jgi:hypothetical protein
MAMRAVLNSVLYRTHVRWLAYRLDACQGHAEWRVLRGKYIKSWSTTRRLSDRTNLSRCNDDRVNRLL